MKFALLGMHRSGTSALAGLMSSMGFWAGNPEELLPPSVTNPKGFWERRKVVEINDRLLRAQKASWFNPLPYDPSVVSVEGLDDIASSITSEINALEAGGKPAILKDPRLCLTMAAWTQSSTWDGFVVMLRDPREVAVSLNTRYGLSYEHGFALWELYNRSIARLAANSPGLTITYDELLASPRQVAERLLVWSIQRGVVPEHLRPPPDEVLSSVVSGDLRRSRIQPDVESIHYTHPAREIWEAVNVERSIMTAVAPLSEVSRHALSGADQVTLATDRGHAQVSELVQTARVDGDQGVNAMTRALARSMDLVDRRLLDISNRLDRNAGETAAHGSELGRVVRRLESLEQQGNARDIQAEAENRAIALRLDYQESALEELNSTMERLSQQLAASLEQQELQRMLGEELRTARLRLDAAELRAGSLAQGVQDLVQYVEAFKRSLRYRWTRYARDALDDFSVRAREIAISPVPTEECQLESTVHEAVASNCPEVLPSTIPATTLRRQILHLEAIKSGTLVPVLGADTSLLLLHGCFHAVGDADTLALLRESCRATERPVPIPEPGWITRTISHIGGKGALARFQIIAEDGA